MLGSSPAGTIMAPSSNGEDTGLSSWRCRVQVPQELQYLMGHSDISVTMNTYTHLGLEDAENELRRLSEINSARVELDRLNGTDFSIESNVKFG